MAFNNKLNKTKGLVLSTLIVVLIIAGCVIINVCSEDSGAASQMPDGTTAVGRHPGQNTESLGENAGLPEPTKPSTIKPGASEPGASTSTNPNVPPELVEPQGPEGVKISCDQVAVFSGKFVEDASDVSVENVAAVLATNRTEQFLELATMNFEIDGKKATFIITGLPAGKSVWVMEATGMTVDSDASFVYQSCGTSFREGVVSTSDEVTISADGNMLTAVNNTERTLESVFIYYKLLHDDGNYFGGITYMVTFGTLEPGQSVEKLGGHYSADDSEIVRIGWQDRQTDEAS